MARQMSLKWPEGVAFPVPHCLSASQKGNLMMQLLCSKTPYGSPLPAIQTELSRMASQPSPNHTFQLGYPSANLCTYPTCKPTPATHWCLHNLCALLSKALLVCFAFSSACWKPHASVPSPMPQQEMILGAYGTSQFLNLYKKLQPLAFR